MCVYGPGDITQVCSLTTKHVKNWPQLPVLDSKNLESFLKIWNFVENMDLSEKSENGIAFDLV